MIICIAIIRKLYRPNDQHMLIRMPFVYKLKANSANMNTSSLVNALPTEQNKTYVDKQDDIYKRQTANIANICTLC